MKEKQQSAPLQVERHRDGQERSISAGRVSIRHRVTAPGVSPEGWSAWEVWGEFPDDETARAAHDWALARGPWNNPFVLREPVKSAAAAATPAAVKRNASPTGYVEYRQYRCVHSVLLAFDCDSCPSGKRETSIYGLSLIHIYSSALI